MTLQAQRDVYQVQLQRCQNETHYLIINRHVPRANVPGKDDTFMITDENTTPEEDDL